MRTTLNLDDDLLKQARKSTGVREKTRLLHMGLEALIQRENGRKRCVTVGANRVRRGVLPVSKARGGLAKGFGSLEKAIATANLKADRKSIR